MKILHTLAQIPGKTGSGVFLQKLYEAGEQKGYTQAVVAGVPKGYGVDKHCFDPTLFFPLVFQTKRLPFAVVGMSDVMPYESRTFASLDPSEFQSYVDAITKHLYKVIEMFKPDVIIAHHLWVMTSLIKTIDPKIQVLALCHGTDLRQAKTAQKITRFVSENISRCDYFFALNEDQKQTITSLYGIEPDKIVVSGSAYDPALFFPKPKNPSNDIHIIYVGKISKAKGVFFLLEAFERIVKPHIHLSLIGGGESKESEELLQKASKIPNVKYEGFVKQKRLIEIFQSSDIFILPSFFEGMPLVVIEALATHLRVVCTKLPGVSEFIGQKLQNSGMIYFVDLPKMETIDSVASSDEESFTQDICEALGFHIEAVQNNETILSTLIDSELCKKSWSGLFCKLEEYF